MANTCPWAVTPGIMKDYHDEEWGVPVHDDGKMFEFLVLESAQAGLSWLTILKKREKYRRAFAGFDPRRVAAFSTEKVEELLLDRGIIRNRMKIEAAVNNAGVFLDIAGKHGSFCEFIWSYTEGEPIVNHYRELSEVPASTPLSTRISRDLKKMGFRFFGPVICYSHMQATGMVNDHMTFCRRHGEIALFRKPVH